MSEENPFWRFSLRFYRAPEVAQACIDLQEDAHVDVNILLFLLWQATRRRALSNQELQQLEARVRPWREATVIPLRNVRRALKSPPALVPPGTAEAFRTRIKAVELEAERLQQEAMYALAQAGPAREMPSPREAAHANISAYQAICRERFPERAVETILTAFASLEPEAKE